MGAAHFRARRTPTHPQHPNTPLLAAPLHPQECARSACAHRSPLEGEFADETRRESVCPRPRKATGTTSSRDQAGESSFKDSCPEARDAHQSNENATTAPVATTRHKKHISKRPPRTSCFDARAQRACFYRRQLEGRCADEKGELAPWIISFVLHTPQNTHTQKKRKGRRRQRRRLKP